MTSRTKSTFKPVILGVNSAKDDIRYRLHLSPPDPGQVAAAYIHFPDFLDLGYYSQLLSESLETKISGGQKYRVWKLRPGRANEALDCLVYAYAALKGLMHHGLRLNALAGAIQKAPERLLPPPAEPEEKTDLSEPGAVIPASKKPGKRRLSQMLP